ncbi:hypothetical protein ACFY5F_21645 [Streptomyces sp. NPDC013161]|uniref:hypothetical protein n=1 Tax=Streptomyces sp. NPDC013161 TaxID=3364862 RepID=UPI00368320E7
MRWATWDMAIDTDAKASFFTMRGLGHLRAIGRAVVLCGSAADRVVSRAVAQGIKRCAFRYVAPGRSWEGRQSTSRPVEAS